MDKKVVGFIIRRERMRRDWSQDGLCRGICAASYLSKIEQGRVEASEDILRLLYERLELPWYGGESALPALCERIDELYELAYSRCCKAPPRRTLRSWRRRQTGAAARMPVSTREWSSISRRAASRC